LLQKIKLLSKATTPERCSRHSLEVIKHQSQTINPEFFIPKIKPWAVEKIIYRHSW